MKLAIIFIAGVLANTREQPLNHHSLRIQKLKDHVNFIVDKWLYAEGCHFGKSPETYRTKVTAVLSRMENLFNRCSQRTDGDFFEESGLFNELLYFFNQSGAMYHFLALYTI